jgi:hypothetical protein
VKSLKVINSIAFFDAYYNLCAHTKFALPPDKVKYTNTIGHCQAGLPVSYASNNSHVADIHDNILTVTGSGSCIITARQEGNDNYQPAIEATKILTYISTGVQESVSTGLLIYPVPAKDYVTIESNDDRIVLVVIINNAGNRLKEELFGGVTKTDLKLDNLMPGMYHLMIRGEKSTIIRQIIKR